MIEFLTSNLGVITSAVLGVGIVSLWVGKLTAALKEIAELLTVVAMAPADKQITKEEIDKIIKEAKDVVAVFKKK